MYIVTKCGRRLQPHVAEGYTPEAMEHLIAMENHLTKGKHSQVWKIFIIDISESLYMEIGRKISD